VLNPRPMRTRPIVAIDGPAGAGKSTVARRVADRLGFVLVDTGALYRSVALAAKRAGLDFKDATRVEALAESLVRASALKFVRDAKGIKTILSGDDVSDAIRTPDIGMGASTVSAHTGVRTALLDMQRQAGADGGVVLEGRDIGTVVFPDAEVKVFLTARPEIRAQRRYEELREKGETKLRFEDVLAEVKARDAQDENRPVAPLKRAPGAVLVDSSDLTIDQAVDAICRLVPSGTT
jgi:CMP/dCMP kinase